MVAEELRDLMILQISDDGYKSRVNANVVVGLMIFSMMITVLIYPYWQYTT